MSAKKRILFIANEMSPYLELTEFSEIVNKLAIKANDNGFEVRCIMPRFGIINERRHRLHEVVRLSGINVSVDNDDMPLQIKVASLPSARLQVYFLENEDLFRRKFVFHDELVRKAKNTTRDNGTYELEMTYNKYSSYGLPDKVIFSFNTKDYKLPKGVTFDYDDGSQKKPDDNLKNKKGRVEITYSEYLINKGIDDVVFK